MDAALTGWVDRFLGYLRSERRYSPSTIDHYAHGLARLQTFAESSRVREFEVIQAVCGIIPAPHTAVF